MASGHANRINRPNTWLHRPTTRRDVLTCPTRSRPHMALYELIAASALVGLWWARRRRVDFPPCTPQGISLKRNSVRRVCFGSMLSIKSVTSSARATIESRCHVF